MTKRSNAGQPPAFEDPDDNQEPEQQGLPVPPAEEDQPTTTEEAAGEGRIPNFLVEAAEHAFPAPEDTGPPEWADVPGDLKIPSGVEVAYLRFKAAWTCAMDKGDRTCVVWPLTDKDEKLALTRIAHNPLSASSELAKQMVRAFDGMKVDWGATPGKAGNIDDFWREIGPKCRSMLQRYHSETHSMKPDELAYFFESCVAVRVGS